MGRMIGGGAPIKAFLEPRSKSVADQLSGKSAGQSSGGGGFMGMGMGMGGIAGMMLAPAFLAAMDTDKDGSVGHQEFTAGFAKWFESWGGRAGGGLTEEQIRAGLDRDLPMRGMPGFGPPPVPPAPGPVIKPIP